jgi:hypothetical protein
VTVKHDAIRPQSDLEFLLPMDLVAAAEATELFLL